MARKRVDDPKMIHVSFRVTQSERDRLERDRGSQPLTEFIRARLLPSRG